MGVYYSNRNRVRIYTIDGVEIWEGDYTSCSELEYLSLMEQQVAYAKEKPYQICYFLLNVAKSPKTSKVIEESQKAVISTQGLVSYSALYGINTLGRVLLKIINVTQNNKIVAFEKKEEALEYLLKTAKKNQENQNEKDASKIR